MRQKSLVWLRGRASLKSKPTVSSVGKQIVALLRRSDLWALPALAPASVRDFNRINADFVYADYKQRRIANRGFRQRVVARSFNSRRSGAPVDACA